MTGSHRPDPAYGEDILEGRPGPLGDQPPRGLHARGNNTGSLATVPESLNINVDLPATIHAAPEDEAAVAIPDVPVDAGEILKPDTLSVPIITPAVAQAATAQAASAQAVQPTGGTTAPVLRASAGGIEKRSKPEPPAMLTADRLLDERKRSRHAPEGGWSRFVYSATFGAVNLGDSRKVRERKAVEARIDKALEGGTRFVPVFTRKGGVGKTTITTLLGMALATAREDRIIAIDANPDRGTLAERVDKHTRNTVRDVVRRASSVHNFTDFSTLVSRDETRLDILASDSDPMLSEAFDEDDYNVVADLCARYYSIALTDCGTGIVHSVMRATLQRADSIVIVSGGSVDEARLASETLTWLESNGFGHLVENAIVAINTATQGTTLVKLEEIEDHFRSRVRDIVRLPYDPHLAAGSIINWDDLKPFTKEAARELAAMVVDGLPSRRTV